MKVDPNFAKIIENSQMIAGLCKSSLIKYSQKGKESYAAQKSTYQRKER